LLIEQGIGKGLREEFFAHNLDHIVDGLLVFLQELSFGGIELVAVTIKWDVAPRYHDTSLALLKSEKGDCRRRNSPKIDRPHASIFQGLHDRLTQTTAVVLYIASGAGPEILREIEVVAFANASF
jgi:hypothetical protein